jgi:hypothetical protein
VTCFCDDDWDEHEVLALKFFFNASQEQVQAGLGLMHADGVIVHSHIDRMAIGFLYIKDIMRSKWYRETENRLSCVQSFLHPKSLRSDGSDASFRLRLLRLLAPGGDQTSCQKPENVQSFDAALEILDKWKDEKKAYIFIPEITW